MSREASIIELAQWLKTPPGRYLVQWELDRLDHAVDDAFGYHALQLGLPEVDGLRANRMPHRWVASDALQLPGPLELTSSAEDQVSMQSTGSRVALHCEYDALPFPNHSLDLVVMPHALELSRDPHLALAEVERVLVPEGRVVIVGFNPSSLWGIRQRIGRGGQRLGIGARSDLYLPRACEFLGYRRVRDWLRLLSFEVESGQFGCYRPPFETERWLQRTAWMDRVGERWWPVLGAVYFIVANKRVRGMRLVGLARQQARRAQAAPAIVANRHREITETRKE